ncbi:Hypothetical Protein FCC1311_027952 [Hondaea fermentalgiana]|uniref:Uncharacterized protein n=1 Tax=Hondaea fermentalgiana TaxID=2315210 RepID=A0A2R5GFE8_9STRA|nr:Hypothetical Protein FCC1311_027952 [Hondaea fermentalgiana]|eukprot:GBG26574.1 Hypothetical Protein FCC1311_027952 [Hondaea fermentalgiana]
MATAVEVLRHVRSTKGAQLDVDVRFVSKGERSGASAFQGFRPGYGLDDRVNSAHVQADREAILALGELLDDVEQSTGVGEMEVALEWEQLAQSFFVHK